MSAELSTLIEPLESRIAPAFGALIPGGKVDAGTIAIEEHETFAGALFEAAGATIARGSANGTILNDETTVHINDASVLEGHSGQRAMTFTVSLSAPTALPVRVTLTTEDGTATAGADYVALLSDALNFAPGETSKIITVDVRGDIAVEDGETFSVLLSEPLNALIEGATGIATILDDDVTLAGPRKATFTDVDGENVTIKVSKGALKVEDFTIFPSGFGAQLALVDFSGESEFAGANLTITAKAPRGVASGDRVAHIGHINATGIDLGKVRISGVLGQIDAGDALTARGLKSLSAQSIGRSGLLTQLPGGSLQSDIDGSLKTLRLADGIHDASLLVDGGISTIDITGSVLGSAIRSEEAIGTIRISGDFAADATITARGRLDPASSSQSVAIRSIAIGGSVEDAQILAGYDLTGAAINADVGIGTVRVSGDWIASDLVAGAIAGADARIGTDDDEPIFRDDAILSKIASVVIKGEVLGSDNGADHFGFVAEEIAAFKVAGNKLAFTPGARNDLAGVPLGPNSDVRIREVA